MANPLKKAKKKLSKARKRSGLSKITAGSEARAKDVGGKVERAGFKDTTQQLGKEWRGAMKEGRDIWQSGAESMTGKSARDTAEASAKYSKQQSKAIEAEKKKTQAEIAKSDALKQKKLRAAREGRRSLLGG